MNLLKRWFEFYIFANIHVAIACYSLTRITYLHYNFQNEFLAFFVFFSTILSYNLIRVVQLDSIKTMTSNWIAANKKGLIFLNAIAFSGMLYCASKLNLHGFYTLMPFMLTTILYVLPAKNKSRGLRQVPGLKLFLISFTWAGVSVVFPLAEANLLELPDQGLYFLQRFLFVLAITIPFDIRDSQFDHPELATLPQVLGIDRAKVIAIAAILGFLAIDIFLKDTNSVDFKIHVMIALITSFFIAFSSPLRKRFYTMFWVEAIPIVWYATLLVFDQGVF
ncbi:hypothetical protein [Lutimonas sp.]|uniref:hypothetical protein n=1 Tax=Lutimonas sp. TaxID=1872403 RepID=UPI003D9B105F